MWSASTQLKPFSAARSRDGVKCAQLVTEIIEQSGHEQCWTQRRCVVIIHELAYIQQTPVLSLSRKSECWCSMQKTQIVSWSCLCKAKLWAKSRTVSTIAPYVSELCARLLSVSTTGQEKLKMSRLAWEAVPDAVGDRILGRGGLRSEPPVRNCIRSWLFLVQSLRGTARWCSHAIYRPCHIQAATPSLGLQALLCITNKDNNQCWTKQAFWMKLCCDSTCITMDSSMYGNSGKHNNFITTTPLRSLKSCHNYLRHRPYAVYKIDRTNWCHAGWKAMF